MVEGLEKFKEHFAGLEDCFVLIGGTACDVWMGESGLEFRATKDLDVVLIVEALRPELFVRFWGFVKDGKYENMQQSDQKPEFYRFKKPKAAGILAATLLTKQHTIPDICAGALLGWIGHRWFVRSGAREVAPRA